MEEELSKVYSELTMIINSLSEEKITEIRQAFEIFDRKGEGIIKTTDLIRTLHALGENPTEFEIDDYINEIDEERLGTLTYKQYLDIIARRIRDDDTEERIREAFRAFDTDGDGIIRATEMRQVMISLGEKLTDEEVDEMIREADKDGDGDINLEEFVAMMIEK